MALQDKSSEALKSDEVTLLILLRNPIKAYLTLKALNSFRKIHGEQRVFSILNHNKCLFLIHLNTYVMGLRPIEIFVLLQCGDRL